MTDTLAAVLLPAVRQGGSPPEWVSMRGGDVRAYDRRSGRLVWGPRHPFLEASDLLLTNGILRLWVGARGLTPYLDVQAFRDGLWRHAGCVHLGFLGDPVSKVEKLRHARLDYLTTERGVIVMDVPGTGIIRAELLRGGRMVRIRHGSEVGPTANVNRRVRWEGLPPYLTLSGVAKADGTFNDGVRVGGRAEFVWPPSATPDAWSVAVRWKPDLGSGDAGEVLAGGPYGSGPYGDGPYGGTSGVPGQDTSGIFAVTDSTGEKVQAMWDTSLGRFTLAAPSPGQVLEAPPITYDAGDDLLVVARFSVDEGLGLSIVDGDGTAHHVTSAGLDDAPTAEPIFRALRLGEADGVFGAAVIDNPQVFMRRLSDAEVEDLGTATSSLDGLGTAEGDLIWHVSFDPALTLTPASSPGGIVAEGFTDGDGFQRGVCVLVSGYNQDGVGVARTTELAEVGAFIATTGTNDGLTAHQAQFAALSRQELRLR